MIRVGVVRGGVSPEYDISIKTGGHVLRSLPQDKYKPVDLFLDREGMWHVNGLPADGERIRDSVDVVFNALHGAFGEDGKASWVFERLGLPYTGSEPEPSYVAFNKTLAKKTFQDLGMKTPRHVLFPAYNEDLDGSRDEYAEKKAQKVYETFPPPWIVKPLTGGSSMGIHVAKTYPELIRAIDQGVNLGVSVIVEEFIFGKEATVGVIDEFRNEKTYALMPIEIVIPKNKRFFDYDTKYENTVEQRCPGNFTNQEKADLSQMAKLIHEKLGLRHYSRTDFIVTPKNGIYVLEVNTLPGLIEESLLPKALSAVGHPFPQFLDHVIGLAIKGNKK